MTSILDADLTHDAFLGGRLHLWQPRAGYRAGVDPVLLAATVPARAGQRVLDLGCGVGTAALCLGARVSGLDLLGVERQADYAALAERNGLHTICADLTDLLPEVKVPQCDHVLANPPFFDRATGHGADDSGREQARGIDTPLAAWIDAAAACLRHKGHLHMIHRAAALPQILAACARRLGSPEVWPLCPRVGRDAELLIFRARKNGRAAFRLHAPVILHQGAVHERDAESYTPAIRAALRDGAALDI